MRRYAKYLVQIYLHSIFPLFNIDNFYKAFTRKYIVQIYTRSNGIFPSFNFDNFFWGIYAKIISTILLYLPSSTVV
jgi:hypothetical protein